MAQLLPVIPEYITVHLGPPGSNAQNVRVPFSDYVKNVASSEIYPTWPENALRANIYAITTFALNRIYTEYYRSRGYDYDITNSTQFDQAFKKDRETFENINTIVDEVFDDYIVKQGTVSPLFSAFCNGTTSTCNGLSQWGTVDLANRGLSPLEILKVFYGNDIEIVENAPVGGAGETYPGVPLTLGANNNNVKIIQTELNRIARNYPAIPKIALENGIFGLDTEAAVRKFQEIFSLPQSGTVDKATWYRIKQYYAGVKSLSELASEGLTPEEVSVPFTTVLSEGMVGNEVRTIQYYLAVAAYFNGNLQSPPLNGFYGTSTVDAVKTFQEFYGLPVTGVMDNDTWNVLSRIYIETVASLPEGYSGNDAKLYPGYFLTVGMRNENVRDLQQYLQFLGDNINALPTLQVTGYYGDQTVNAVETFQRLYGLPVSGSVGPLTWFTIAKEYDALKNM